MYSLHTSVGRVWRLLLSATLISCAAITSTTAGFPDPDGDPPLLASLQLQSGTGPIGFAPAPLSPAFVSDINSLIYDISIPFEHSQVEVVSASTVEPFHDWLEPSIPQLLAGLTTSFNIDVVDDLFSPSQVTTYTINVTRGPSNNIAVLSNLIVSGTSLSPSFGQLTFDYTGSVPNDTTSIAVTPTAQATETSSIAVNGNPADSGTAFGPIPLAVGSNEIIIKVKDGQVTKAYVIDITRLPPNADSDNDGMEDGFETANGLNVGIDDAKLDLDGDGLSNIFEYAFGSDPDDSSDHNDPVITQNASGFLVITFNPAIQPDDGSYEVQVSSTLGTLGNWSSTEVTEEGNSTPTVQVWRDTAGGSPTPPPDRFIRVGFTSSL